MAKTAHFNPEIFGFLTELGANNHREWFADNKPRYEAHVKAPLQSFITDFGPHLAKISGHFVADPRGNGGSMFRIYRDTRFSKDKTPYKTHAAAQFRHAQGKDVHAPGFYLHIEPGQVFAGCGIWKPDSASLKKIRTAISEDGAGWKRAIGAKAFKARYTLTGESLTRPPRGFDAEHALIEDIKRKDFVATFTFSTKDLCQPGFLGEYVKACKAANGFMKYLTTALELPY